MRQGRRVVRLTGIFDSAIVVGINTDLVSLCLKRVLTVLHRPQLVLGVEVWPAPQLTVENVWQTLLLSDLRNKAGRTKSWAG